MPSCLRSRRQLAGYTGTCAESHAGADCGCPRASDHGDNLPVIQERVLNRTLEQIVDVLVPQITEDNLPVIQERVQNCTPEQIVDVLVPQIMEDSLPVVPQERVQHRTQEQMVDVLVPRIYERSVQLRT